jgi:hypothetical protein
MEETGGGQRYLETNYRRSQGPVRGVAPLKKRKYDVIATL